MIYRRSEGPLKMKYCIGWRCAWCNTKGPVYNGEDDEFWKQHWVERQLTRTDVSEILHCEEIG